MLSREGLPLALGFGLGAAAVTHSAGVAWGTPLWVAFAAVVYVFYNRRCESASQPNAIVAPVDGVVTRVGDLRDSWLARDAVRVRVKLEFPGVTVTRSPVSGKVIEYRTGLEPFDGPGGRASARARPQDSAIASPNAYALHLQTDEGEDVVSVVSSLRSLSRVKLDLSPGSRVGQSHRYGFVYFSDYVDVLLSSGSRPEVKTGQRVRSGETLLATLPRGAAASRTAAAA